MPERSTSTDSYRYAYNGMEMDNEVSGNGNSYTTEFRQYDARLGRWKSLDPLMGMFPHMSPYVAFDNNPVYYNDIYGLSAGKKEKDKPTSRNPYAKAEKYIIRKKIKNYSLVELSDGGSVALKYSKTNSNGESIAVAKVFYWNGKLNHHGTSFASFRNKMSDISDGLLGVFKWMNSKGGGDNYSGLHGGHTLVTEQEGLKEKSAINGTNGSPVEVNGDLLGAGKSSVKLAKGTYSDAGDKARQIAKSFADGVKISQIVKSKNTEDKRPLLVNAEVIKFNVTRYIWSQEPSDSPKGGGRWSGDFDRNFNKSLTLSEIKNLYPNAEWNKQGKVFVVNPRM